MKKFTGMLFCTDLDGTLYSDDKTVSKENLAAIEYFQAQGGLFTFITGRMPQTSMDICRIIRPNAPFGCINGGGIYDPQTKAFLWRTFLPDAALELVKAVDTTLPEMGIQLNTEQEIWFCKDNDAMVYFRAVTGLPNISCHYDKIETPVLKVVFAHEAEEQILALQALLNSHAMAPQFDFIRSERRLYEILPKGVSKGTALCKLAQLLGVRADKTIAVGDYDNDVSMIRTAKVGFAVSNAVDAAKAAADSITVSNNEHAIAAIIDMLDRGAVEL